MAATTVDFSQTNHEIMVIFISVDKKKIRSFVLFGRQNMDSNHTCTKPFFSIWYSNKR